MIIARFLEKTKCIDECENTYLNISVFYSKFEFCINNDILEISENPDFIPSFYGENTTSLTAIVGRNASGKSRLLKRLLETIPKNESINPNSILILYSPKDKTFYTSIGTEMTLEVSAPSEDYKISKNLPKSEEFSVYMYSSGLEPTSFVDPELFLSQDETKKKIQFVDLTTNSSLAQWDNYDKFKQNEMREQISLLVSNPDLINLWSLSTQLKLHIKDESLHTKTRDDFIRKVFSSKVPFLYANGFQVLKDFVENPIYLIFNHAIKYILQNIDLEANRDFYVNFLKLLNSPNITDPQNQQSLFDSLESFVKDYMSRHHIKKAKQQYLYITEHFTEKTLLGFEDIKLRLNSNIQSLFSSEFSDVYGDLFTLGWFSISAGESYLLSSLSRLFEQLTKNTREKDTTSEIIFILDEPDLGLHPALQKKWWTKFNQALTYLFPTYCFQVIITTHSPILLSDILSENVIMIQESKVLKQTEDTFGSNIHDLFQNAFFMDDTLIGDHSNRIIRDIIQFLHEDKKTNEDSSVLNWSEQQIVTVINQIGEPVLKNALLMMRKRQK